MVEVLTGGIDIRIPLENTHIVSFAYTLKCGHKASKTGADNQDVDARGGI